MFYAIEHDPSIGPLYRHRGVTTPPEDYPRTLWAGVFAQFTVTRRNDDSPIGLVTGFALDTRNGHCRVAALTLPAYRRLGWPIEAVDLFFQYIFQTFRVRKIYLDVLAFNLDAFRSIVARGGAVEAHFRDHEYYDGRYYDLFTIAVRPDTWMSKQARGPSLKESIST